MTSENKFQNGEKVLCYRGPMIYQAKCLGYSVNKQTNAVSYLIHYTGWNQRWDELVPEENLLKYNEDNLKKQEKVLFDHSSKKVNGEVKKQERKQELKEESSEKMCKTKEEEKDEDYYCHTKSTKVTKPITRPQRKSSSKNCKFCDHCC